MEHEIAMACSGGSPPATGSRRFTQQPGSIIRGRRTNIALAIMTSPGPIAYPAYNVSFGGVKFIVAQS
jgi:hypothetical protein